MSFVEGKNAPAIFCHLVQLLYDESMDILEEEPILRW